MRAKDKLETMRILFETQSKSGLSNTVFCQTHGIKEHVYYYWKNKLASMQATQEGEFVAIDFQSPNVALPDFRIVYPNGVAIEIKGCNNPIQLKSFINLY